MVASDWTGRSTCLRSSEAGRPRPCGRGRSPGRCCPARRVTRSASRAHGFVDALSRRSSATSLSNVEGFQRGWTMIGDAADVARLVAELVAADDEPEARRRRAAVDAVSGGEHPRARRACRRRTRSRRSSAPTRTTGTRRPARSVPPTMLGRDVEASSDDSFFFELRLGQAGATSGDLDLAALLGLLLLDGRRGRGALVGATAWRSRGACDAEPDKTETRASPLSRWRARGEKRACARLTVVFDERPSMWCEPPIRPARRGPAAEVMGRLT